MRKCSDENNLVNIDDDNLLVVRPEIDRRSSSVFDGFKLRIEDLIVWVPAKKKKPFIPILKGISTEIENGKMTAIIGPSGSGKTTMMNYLSGRQNYSR